MKTNAFKIVISIACKQVCWYYINVNKKGGIEMASITVRMDDELHKNLKIKVAQDGTTITQYIIDLLERELNDETQAK